MLIRITRLLIAVLGGMIGLEVGSKVLPLAEQYLALAWTPEVRLLLHG